ncbi:NPCBM/NEW2 domain-containing protein [Agreia pratensis]|uniref:NPCBM/NEW2 domain-containing protein n=2 Tax=Agreia pratensis TaxID=150121 RepID=A0A1X7KT13_9MICO|nr:NPCBM/NEW2 domain-containing protein [Agreia pratensis]
MGLRRRPIVLVSVFVSVIGILLIGFAVGQLVFPRTVVAASDDGLLVNVPSSPEDAIAPTMPDLLGLDEQSARRALSDSGLASDVTIAEQAAAGAAGLVVGQQPPAGSSDAAEGVTLTLSTASTVPDVVGSTSADARTALEQLGAIVTVLRSVQPGAADGTVLAVSPSVGSPLDRVVELTVADAGVALALGDLDRVGGQGCSVVSQGTVNGTDISDSLACRSRTGDTSAEWNLGRHASVLEATVGALDSAEQGAARLQIFGDGVLLVDQPIEFGKSSVISVDVRNVLRLKLVVSGAANGPTAVLGNGIVRATPDEVALIRAGT